MPDLVAYADRFQWLRQMLESDMDPTAKAIMAWLWASLDKNSGRTTRHLETVASKMKMKKATVRAAISRAKKAGWIVSSGAGGIAHDDEGNRRGLASTYSMSIPANQLARYDQTCENEAGNVLTRPVQGANEVGVTCEPVSTNTLSSSHTTHIDSSGVVSANEIIRRPDIGVKSLWGDRWPQDQAPISPASTLGTDDWVRSRIVDIALEIMGFSSSAIRSPSDHATWSEVSSKLKALKFVGLMSAYRSGDLTKVDVATEIASHGIVPPVIEMGEQYAKAS